MEDQQTIMNRIKEVEVIFREKGIGLIPLKLAHTDTVINS